MSHVKPNSAMKGSSRNFGHPNRVPIWSIACEYGLDPEETLRLPQDPRTRLAVRVITSDQDFRAKVVSEYFAWYFLNYLGC